MTTHSGFEAGISRACITPPLSVPHAGWGAQTHVFADGVDRDLHATVLVLRTSSATVVFAELDLVIISRAESDAIRAAIAEILGIGAESIRVSVTHNHAGPPPSSWNWMTQGRDALTAYYQSLPAIVSGAALEAARACKPARFGSSIGASRVAVNRREQVEDGMATGVNRDGSIDEDLLVVRIDALDGSPIASIVGYTMHPTVLGPGNRHISPDWPGHMKRAMEDLTGATCLFLQGATGDIGPGPDGFADNPANAARIGTRVACDAAALYLSMDIPPRTYYHERVWDSGAPLGKWTFREEELPTPVLAIESTRVDLPLQPQLPLDQAQAAVDEAQQRLNSAVNQGAPESEVEDATFAVKRANMTLSRVTTFGGLDAFPLEVSAIRIGPLVIVGAECEPFSATAKLIKERSSFDQTWFGGYTGGWFGYVPTADEYPLGGYEVDTSPYTPEAANALEDGTVQLIERLAQRQD